MSSLYSELKRRHVFRVGLAYIITPRVLAQVADLLLESFATPNRVLQSFLVFLVLGFPISAILAWAFELTPDGVKLDSDLYAGVDNTSTLSTLGDTNSARTAPNSIAVLPFTDMS